MSSDMQKRIIGAAVGLGIGDLNHGPVDRALVLGNHLISSGKLNILNLASDYVDYWKFGGYDLGMTQGISLKVLADGFETEEDIQVHRDYVEAMWKNINYRLAQE